MSGRPEWEILVTRKGSIWKNYIMVSSFELAEKIFGFTLQQHLTTREGDEFTHWVNQTVADRFSREVLRHIVTDREFTKQWQKEFKRTSSALKKYAKQLSDLSYTGCDNKKLFIYYERYNNIYRAVYPTFHISVYTNLIDKVVKKRPENEMVAKFINLAASTRLAGRSTFATADQQAQNLFTTISERIGEDCGWFLPEEIRSVLLEKNKFDKKRISGRKKYCVLIWKNSRTSFLEGVKAKKYFPRKKVEKNITITKLRGTVVCEKGVVVGIVRLIMNKNDSIKVKYGDIVVTKMTTVDLLPSLRKTGIAGVITDEGGLTCHAAVLARELDIPCLVGTGRATSFLKEGELVKLDSEKGIVIKL